ncbi:MAG: alginate export family protein [Sphingomonadales bacterium]|nr:alginate export family protein [Sphingomonadales bacterium]
MRTRTLLAAAVLAAAAGIAVPAAAHTLGEPITVDDTITVDPMLDARLRWEDVDAAKAADAVTLRARFGFEARQKALGLSFLAEGQGTVALDKGYNAFPFVHPASNQYRPADAVIADPESIALNRLQLQYRTKALALTLGRQRINLDDQRWVGNAGWRQNEQTFDAVRLETGHGPLAIDLTYSNSQRTIYGRDSGPRRSFDGDFGFLGATLKAGPVAVKGFAYLVDYGDPLAVVNSSQTYGFRATAGLPLARGVKLNLAGSYARQSSFKTTPFRFAADYVAIEGGLGTHGFTATAGYEKLGSDGGLHALQTPLATLHKFNGWADLFLTTPAKGLQDAYGGVAYAFPGVKAVKGLSATVVYHQFDSDVGAIDYGHEWDLSAGLKTGKVAWLVKYATYTARGFGVDTKKFWLQAEFAL